jgi:hypothetical protein
MHTKLDGAAKAVKYAVDLERAGRDFGRAKSLVLLRYFEVLSPFRPVLRCSELVGLFLL